MLNLHTAVCEGHCVIGEGIAGQALDFAVDGRHCGVGRVVGLRLWLAKTCVRVIPAVKKQGWLLLSYTPALPVSGRK